MYRTEFADLQFLKGLIARREANCERWPTCILHVRTQEEYRPQVNGPLSIFLNLKGRSVCKVGSREVVVETGHYFLSNSGDRYDLLIDGSEPTETFNIHIEQNLMEEVYTGMNTSEVRLLDQPDHAPHRDPQFFSQLYRRDAFLDGLIGRIQAQAVNDPRSWRLIEAEQMSQLLVHLVSVHEGSLLEMGRLAGVKRATREETYRRLIQARDYIHSHYREALSLDALAGVACMSRYHFLRAFKSTFHCTPYQYLKALRLEKACDWLQGSERSVQDIGFVLGYQNLSSFSRVFQQSLGMGPSAYRNQFRKPKLSLSLGG